MIDDDDVSVDETNNIFLRGVVSGSPYRFTDSLGGGIHLRRVKVRDLLSHDNVYPGYTCFVEHAGVFSFFFTLRFFNSEIRIFMYGQTVRFYFTPS